MGHRTGPVGWPLPCTHRRHLDRHRAVMMTFMCCPCASMRASNANTARRAIWAPARRSYGWFLPVPEGVRTGSLIVLILWQGLLRYAAVMGGAGLMVSTDCNASKSSSLGAAVPGCRVMVLTVMIVWWPVGWSDSTADLRQGRIRPDWLRRTRRHAISDGPALAIRRRGIVMLLMVADPAGDPMCYRLRNNWSSRRGKVLRGTELFDSTSGCRQPPLTEADVLTTIVRHLPRWGMG